MTMSRHVVLVALILASLPAAHADDTGRHALRATVRISDGKRSGTGFVVALPPGDEGNAAHLLVTAAHVLTNNKGPDCTVVFRVAGGAAGYERRELKLPVRNGDTALWERHPTADVAVIEITPPTDADLRPFTLDQLADRGRVEAGAVAAGQRIWVACFPAQLEANRAGWPILRHGTIASHPLFPVDATPTIFLDYSHFGGDSGAAAVVDDDGRPVVVGVVVSMQRQTDRMTSPFEERTIHTPLDLAIAVQAALVRDTIAAWRKQHAGEDTPAR